MFLIICFQPFCKLEALEVNWAGFYLMRTDDSYWNILREALPSHIEVGECRSQ